MVHIEFGSRTSRRIPPFRPRTPNLRRTMSRWLQRCRPTLMSHLLVIALPTISILLRGGLPSRLRSRNHLNWVTANVLPRCVYRPINKRLFGHHPLLHRLTKTQVSGRTHRPQSLAVRRKCMYFHKSLCLRVQLRIFFLYRYNNQPMAHYLNLKISEPSRMPSMAVTALMSCGMDLFICPRMDFRITTISRTHRWWSVAFYVVEYRISRVIFTIFERRKSELVSGASYLMCRRRI